MQSRIYKFSALHLVDLKKVSYVNYEAGYLAFVVEGNAKCTTSSEQYATRFINAYLAYCEERDKKEADYREKEREKEKLTEMQLITQTNVETQPSDPISSLDVNR